MSKENNEYHSDQEVRIDNHRSAAVITKDSSILMMYRKKKGKEFYVLVGGHMRQGENLEQTLIREIMEEASIEVKNIKPAFDFKDYIKDNYDHYFLCEWKSGEVKLGDEELHKNSPENKYELQWICLKRCRKYKFTPKSCKRVDSRNSCYKKWYDYTIISHSLTLVSQHPICS